MIKLIKQLPDFCLSHWLLRIPLAIFFLQAGLDKLPYDPNLGEGFGVPPLVWFFVVWGEIGAGLGLLIGGVIQYYNKLEALGDLLTRFSGFTIGCIMTGIIWMSNPASFSDVIIYDTFHVLLWSGGLIFALRSNKL